MTYKKIASGRQTGMKSFDKSGARRLIEIDHNIAAKYDVEQLFERESPVHKVKAAKGYFLFYRSRYFP
jgi:hypothetical protein